MGSERFELLQLLLESAPLLYDCPCICAFVEDLFAYLVDFPVIKFSHMTMRAVLWLPVASLLDRYTLLAASSYSLPRRTSSRAP
jgi:hypothetical protein